MTHTLKVIAGGFALLAGYSVAEEAPVILVVFAVPAVVAVFVAWRLAGAK